MPLLTLWKLLGEHCVPEELGDLSVSNGDTFADFRQALEALCMIEFLFDFWDVTKMKRISRVFERGIKVEDHAFKVYVIPSVRHGAGVCLPQSVVDIQKPQSGSVGCQGPLEDESLPSWMELSPTLDVGQSDTIRLSSNASNDPPGGSSQVGQPSTASLVQVTDDGSKETQSRIDLGSKVMSPQFVHMWKRKTRELEAFMTEMKYEDHSWIVKTWDLENVAHAHLECLECEQSFNGSSKGVMSTASISNCFTNFKNNHVDTNKHRDNWCLKRKLPLNEGAVKKKSKGCSLDQKSLVNLGVEILNTINQEEVAAGQPVFIVIGDLNKVPCFAFYYKVQCTFCLDMFTLVPLQRNLEHNLREHVASAKHIEAVQRKKGNVPLLTGKAGRPGKPDKRDTKQKSIHKYFGHDQGKGDRSSRKGMMEVNISFSLLCWGMWKENVKVSGMNRPVKAMLDDQLMGTEWYSEPYVRVQVWNDCSERVESICGTFRHRSCSRVTSLGGGFVDLMCEFCANIPLQNDFRLRALREQQATEKRGTRDSGKGRRLQFLTNEELHGQSRSYVCRLNSDKKKIRKYKIRICMLGAKVPSLREMVGEAVNRKDVYKFCSTIVEAHRRGVFGGKSAVWDFLKDIVLNLNRKKQGKRYSKGTKVICQALFHHGGRRVVECLSANMLGPSLNTLQRDRRGMLQFRPGFHKEQFILIADVLSKAKERLGIVGDIPCLFSEDETAIKKSVRWLAKSDVLIGFCGPKDEHPCACGLELEVGCGPDGFQKIMTSFENQIIGTQARVIIVNPLHESLPRMLVMATTTCNTFRSPWVRYQWDQLLSMWNEFCRAQVGPIIGHASDGDPRRRKLMLEDYRGEGIAHARQNLGWAGWVLTHSWIGDDAYGLHDQDFIHNLKKLVGPLDSAIRILHAGGTIITLEHLELVYALYSVEEHGLNREDLSRTDRQNWASAQRLCSRKVLSCLKLMRERKDAQVEMTLGTETYLSICGDYLDIFLNVRLTLRERVVLCGKVSFFFRLWRLWLKKGNDKVAGNTTELTLDNMLSMEAFNDIQMSCHYVVLLIVLFRDKYPNLACPFHLTGSDCCEQFFSKVGGMNGHERSYDFAELIDSASGLNRLAELEMSDGIMSVGKSHKKYKNVWMKLHPLLDGEQVADLSDYSELSTNALIVEALKEGLQQARNLCTSLEMNPSTSARTTTWWEEPWIAEVQLGFESEVCFDHDSDGLENTLNFNSVPNIIDVAEDMPTSLSCDDSDDDQTVVEGEFRHIISELSAELEEDEGMMVHDTSKIIDPKIEFEGKSIYKSTLVSQLVGNPRLSKDRLMRVRNSIYFNNLSDKIDYKAGEPVMLMGVGSDIGVYFLEPIVNRNKTRASSAKKRSSRACATNALAVPARQPSEKATWIIGRVQRVRRKYGKTWTKAREQVNLLNKPVPKPDQEGSVCEVLCNWYAPMATKGKYKYTVCDPLWVDLESVITTVSMTVHLNNPSIFTLNANDQKCLDEFVKQLP